MLWIDENGILTAECIIARTGIQDYLGAELGEQFEKSKVYKVFRPIEEVGADETILSFEGVPLTNNHPTDAVSSDTYKDVIIGAISSPRFEDNVIKAMVKIYDKEAQEFVKNGKVELSAGYNDETIEQSGVYNGVKYDLICTKIRGNHVALVDMGRCGNMCKIKIDERKTMIIDGIEHTEDTIKLLIDSKNAELVQKDEAMAELEKEKTDLCGEVEKKDASLSELMGELEALKAKIELMMPKEEVEGMVEEMSDVKVTADTLGVKLDCACPFKGKQSILAHAVPSIKDSIMTMDKVQVDAIYSLKKAEGAFKSGIVLKQDREIKTDSAKDKYLAQFKK